MIKTELDLFLTNLDFEIMKQKDALKKCDVNSFEYKFLSEKIEKLIVVKQETHKKLKDIQSCL